MSNKFKGTPGPWRITAFDSVVCGKFAWSSYAEGSFNKYEDEYNAKLIAAAPELLEALIEMQRNGQKQGWNDNYESSMLKTQKAINKALGEE